MKVLVGIDGSEGSLAATRMAGRLLSPEKDQIGFYFSLPRLTIGGQAASREELLERARQAVAQSVLKAATAQLPEASRSNVYTRVGMDNPRRGLIDAAADWGAELIIVGARGRGPMATRLLGSVARSVVHAATVPVLVVREAKVPATAAMRLMLCHDGTESSLQAARFLSRLNLAAGSVGRVMTAVEPFFAGEIPTWLESHSEDPEIEAMAQVWTREHQENVAAKRAEIERLCQQLPAAFHSSPPIVAEGVPADKILETIEKEKIELVTVGARGAGALARMLVGSTSDQVVLYAPISVLVVRQSKQT